MFGECLLQARHCTNSFNIHNTSRCGLSSHFTGGENKESESNLPKVTQIVRDGTEIQTQADVLWYPCIHCLEDRRHIMPCSPLSVMRHWVWVNREGQKEGQSMTSSILHLKPSSKLKPLDPCCSAPCPSPPSLYTPRHVAFFITKAFAPGKGHLRARQFGALPFFFSTLNRTHHFTSLNSTCVFGSPY